MDTFETMFDELESNKSSVMDTINNRHEHAEKVINSALESIYGNIGTDRENRLLDLINESLNSL